MDRVIAEGRVGTMMLMCPSCGQLVRGEVYQHDDPDAGTLLLPRVRVGGRCDTIRRV
jgi:hypothetical protein